MNSIKLRDNKIIISFKFDPRIVGIIRGIDGRQWNAEAKQWEVPAENVEEVIESLEGVGSFIIDKGVRDLRNKQKEIFNKMDDIKKNLRPIETDLPLHDYQKVGAYFLREMPHALLGDAPGIGKTLQALEATKESPQILILTMNTLKWNMAEEIKKWYPNEKALVIAGDKQLRKEQWIIHSKKHKYVIANYDLLLFDLEEMSRFHWHTIICDEATRISNPESKTSKALKTLKSTKRIALTATPLSNSPLDVYGIFDFLIPKYLGTFYQFKEKYCITDQRFNNVIGFRNTDILAEKIDRFMLRRRKEEVFKELPPKVVETVTFPLNKRETEMYQAIKKQIVDDINKLSEKDLNKNLHIIPVKMLRLKQCTNHQLLVGGGNESTKFKVMEELLETILGC